MHSIRTAVIAIATLLVVANACDGGREGDRCNPNLSHDECGAGLSCVAPSTCVETYCCPANASSSSNAYCNGSGCPAAEAGTTDAAAE